MKPLSRADKLFTALFAAAGFCEGLVFLRARGGRPVLEDEFAYIFQARTFALGHATMPSPPLPEFFEAAHLIVVPRWGAKYFPGQAALLAPLSALHAEWLWPCLTLAAAAALVFAILRRAEVATAAAAAGAIALLACGDAMCAWTTYLSQPTAALWVLGAVFVAPALAAQPTAGHAAALTACAAAAGLTRPFVGVALAVAALALALRVRPKPAVWIAAAVPLALAAAAALAFSAAATGHATLSPWAHYASQYMPFDGPGFWMPRPRRQERPLPAHLVGLARSFFATRQAHTLANLPGVLAHRLHHLYGWLASPLLLPAALAGLVAFRRLGFALLFAGVFFAVQLFHHPTANFFYLELAPIVAILVGAGLHELAKLARRIELPRLRLAAYGAGALWLILAATGASVVMLRAPGWADALVARQAQVDAALAPAAAQRGLVFLRYPRSWDGDVDFGYNDPDLARAALVRAIDLGDRDAELRAMFPDRPAFLFDVATRKLTPLGERTPQR